MNTKINAESVVAVESYTSNEINKSLSSILELSFANMLNIKIKDRLF